jgi:hypothetical protein
MPTNTYVALDLVTVTSATPSITFTGINQGYTDLVLVVSARAAASYPEVAGFIRVGSGSVDSGSNYSSTRLLGTGSAASSARTTNVTRVPWDAIPAATSASGNFCTTIIQIQNYSNATTYKTMLIRSNEPNNYTEATVGLWRNTAAINQLQIYADAGNLAAGSTFSLYGIAASGVGAKATGGTIFSDSQYYYHAFPASGTFTPTQSITADCLVVAGGAGGGRSGGGGGAGGLLAFTSQSLTATGYTITVGSGGAGNNVDGQTGTVGGDSQFAALTLVKGGGGGGSYNANGATGGSGGGGGGFEGGTKTGGSATSGQGSAGGNGFNGSSSLNRAGGGGGGAGASGAAAASAVGGNGGIGSTTYSSWGVSTGIGQNVSGTYYLAGGGGGYAATGGTGGSGGGGGKGVNGTANTGGGGGGSASDGTVGFNGGSGVVIIRYLKA